MYSSQTSANQQGIPVAKTSGSIINDTVQKLRISLQSTPNQMTALMAACIVVVLFMAAMAYNTYANLHSAVQTIGRDTVPSIIAAEEINALLADTHANVMNALLTGEKDNGPYWKLYRDEINQVHNALITASQNITYGDKERVPILTIMSKLGEYEYAMGKVRATPPNDAAVSYDFLTANQLMRQDILPACAALDEANFSPLGTIYQAHIRSFGFLMIFLWLVILFTLFVLGRFQYYLFRHTNRILNPGLVAATVILLFFSLYATIVFRATDADLKTAKADAFDSVHALSKARAVAYDGNADESMYLLFHGNADAQTKLTADFQTKAAKLTDIDPQTALKAQKFGGYLGTELSNITFPGEREAATDTLRQWAEYIRIDGQIRDWEKQGRHQEAVLLNVGTKPGQSNWQFDKFDKALGRTLEINKTEFNNHIDSAFGRLAIFPYVLAACTIASIIAIILGMKARLNEYRF